MPVIADIAEVGNIPTDGIPLKAYKASRFSSPPQLNAAPPDGNPADATAISGPVFGGLGHFRLTVQTAEPYYVSATAFGTTSWQYYEIAQGTDPALTAAICGP